MYEYDKKKIGLDQDISPSMNYILGSGVFTKKYVQVLRMSKMEQLLIEELEMSNYRVLLKLVKLSLLGNSYQLQQI